MKRRAERTYFNTEYMPHIYEVAIESNDPLEIDRMTPGELDDVVKADRERFYRLCRKYGYDCTTIKKESRRNHPDF